MGNILTAFYNLFADADRPLPLLLVGLHGAGKSTLLRRLVLGDAASAMPTPPIGYSVEAVSIGHCNVMVWTIFQPNRVGPLLQHYFRQCRGIMYVIDCSDRERLDDACDQLASLLAEPSVNSRCAFLILANKADLPTAISPRDLSHKLDDTLVRATKRGIRWRLWSTIALSGGGVQQGFHWLQSVALEN